MNIYSKEFELRWSDVDANMHVMHSKYYELAAHCRMSFLYANGITPELFKQEMFGPILFREECIFKRELVAGEIVSVSFVLTKARRDGSRFSVAHEMKKKDDTVAAHLFADLAWMDLLKRKLTVPPPIVAAMIDQAPKHPDFVFEER